MLDRHEVLAEEEFFPLAAARAKRHQLAAFRSKLRALRYSEDAIGLRAAARPDGTISLGALLAAFREAGHEVGPRRREDLELILRQLYVSGYLDSADESGEAPAAPVGEHEAAMKMWWSR